MQAVVKYRSHPSIHPRTTKGQSQITKGNGIAIATSLLGGCQVANELRCCPMSSCHGVLNLREIRRTRNQSGDGICNKLQPHFVAWSAYILTFFVWPFASFATTIPTSHLHVLPSRVLTIRRLSSSVSSNRLIVLTARHCQNVLAREVSITPKPKPIKAEGQSNSIIYASPCPPSLAACHAIATAYNHATSPGIASSGPITRPLGGCFAFWARTIAGL